MQITKVTRIIVVSALLLALLALLPLARSTTGTRVSIVQAAPNAQLLYSFETGTEGWGPGYWQTPPPGTVAQTTEFATDGTHGLRIDNTGPGSWYGRELNPPIDLNAYATLRFDVKTGENGTSQNIALKIGGSYEWCQVPAWGWINPNTTTTVEIDLQQNFACNTSKQINRADIRAIYVFYSPGTFFQDNFRAEGVPGPTNTPTPRNTPGPTPTFLPSPSPAPRSADFVVRTGINFRLDREKFRFSGTNNYYLIFKSKAMVDDLLTTAANNNFNVVRTWAFLDIGYDDDTESVNGKKEGVYFHYFDGRAPRFNDGPDGIQRLDYVIYRAQQLGIKLVLPLTNNWVEFGGMDQYVKWRGGQYHDEFYTDPVIREWYKGYIYHMLNHVNVYTGVAYKNDPTIMTWELANEPRCKGSGAYPQSSSCTPQTLTNWVSEMSLYIKTLDRNHLVSTGDEGFYCDPSTPNDWTRNCLEGVDTIAFTQVRTIDYMSLHLYPDGWGKTADWGTWWINQHIQDAHAIGKPVVLGEFGILDRTPGQPFRKATYKTWTDAIYTNGGNGDMHWMLAAHQDDGTLYPDYDGFTVYCPSLICWTLSSHAIQMAGGTPGPEPTATPTSVPTATPTPTATPVPGGATVLYSFESGTEGWAPAPWQSPAPGAVTQSTSYASDGSHSLQVGATSGGWFVVEPATALNLMGKTFLRFDLTVPAATSIKVSFSTGSAWNWHETTDIVIPAGTSTVVINLTTDLTDNGGSLANPEEVHRLGIYYNAGTYYQDYFRAE